MILSKGKEKGTYIHEILRKYRNILIGLGATCLGAIVGLLLTTPMWDLVVSVTGILVHLATIIAAPLSGLLLWVVSNPFGELYINISLGESIPDLSPARFCVAFLCTLLLAQTAIRKRKLAPLTTTDIAGGLLLFGLGLSIINEHSEWQETVQIIFDQYYVPILVYFFAKNLVLKHEDVNKVLGVTVVFGVYAAIYAIYENLTGNILFTNEPVYFTMYQDSGLHVLRGLLNRSDHFGALFSIVIPVNFYLYLQSKTSAKKILYGFTLVLLFVGIYLTYKRTAWISLLLSFFVIQLFYKQFRRTFLVLLLVFGVVIGASWQTVSQSVVVTDRINSKLSTAEGRTRGWDAALRLWSQKPVFGYGFGNYKVVAQQTGVDDSALENEHLSILFGSGLLGFLPYLAWLVLLGRDSIQLYLKSRQNKDNLTIPKPELFVIFWGIMLGYVVNYTTATMGGETSVVIVFYLLTGAIIGSQCRFLSPASQTASPSIPEAQAVFQHED